MSAPEIQVTKRQARDVGGCSACDVSAADPVQVAEVRLNGTTVRVCRACSVRLRAELARVFR